MRPKPAELVSEHEWEIFAQVRAAVLALPPSLTLPAVLFGVRLPLHEATSTSIPNCHAIAHALARYFPVEVHDGFLVEWREDLEEGKDKVVHYHSWLTIRGGNPKVIIDAWPLGLVSGPTLAIQELAFRYREFDEKERKKNSAYFRSLDFNLPRLALQVALGKILATTPRAA